MMKLEKQLMCKYLKFFFAQFIVSYIIYVICDFFHLYTAVYGEENIAEFSYWINLFLFIFVLMGFPYIVNSFLVYKYNSKSVYILAFFINAIYLYCIDFLFFKCTDFCSLYNDFIRVSVSCFFLNLYRRKQIIVKNIFMELS